MRSQKARGKYLAKSLERLGPSFVKFGQALSVRADIIGQDIATALESLQDRMPPFSTTRAIATIEKELEKPLVDIFKEFADKPVAAASIAQVHKAILKDGKVVAVKIIRPGIERKFKHDVALFYFIARILSWIPSCKRLRPIAVVDVFARIVKKELDLRLEAASASQIRENCKNDEGVYIPQIFWEYTARHVLVMEWVEGITINDKDALVRAGHNLKTISERLAIAFLNQAYRDGFFHADIHPGNLFVDKEGRIVPVDFGIMGRLDKSTRIYVAEILRGFLTADYMYVAQLHFDAGYVPADKSVYDFALACRAIGEPVIGLPANQISIGKLLAMLFKVTEDFQMQTQPQLLLLQKTMVLIEGVGMQLYPHVNMWQMAEGWIGSWVNDNMGFEAHAKETLRDLYHVLKNLPKRLRELDKIIERMAERNKV
jgi:ubiquinone biosynthesis protein